MHKALYIHPIQIVYLQRFMYTAFVALRAGGFWNAPPLTTNIFFKCTVIEGVASM